MHFSSYNEVVGLATAVIRIFSAAISFSLAAIRFIPAVIRRPFVHVLILLSFGGTALFAQSDTLTVAPDTSHADTDTLPDLPDTLPDTLPASADTLPDLPVTPATLPPSCQEELDLLVASENHPAVLDLLDSLLANGHYSRELSWQYARSLFLAGRLDMARDSLLLWESDSVYQTRSENMLVQVAVQQRNHLDAVKYLIRLRDRFPHNPVYPHRLARVFNAMNQLSGAEGQYARAYRLDTLNQLVIGEWADVLQEMGLSERAYSILKRGIRVSPENQGFRRQMVGLTYEMNTYDETIEHAEFLTQHGDTTAQTVKLKAFSLYQFGLLDRAEYWIDYLLDNEFIGEDVFFYKAKILTARGDKDRAQDYYYESVHNCMSQNFNTFALQTGINLYEIMDYDAAIRWMRMLRNFSDNPLVNFYLAASYFEFYEDKDPALEYFQLFADQSVRDEEEPHRRYAKNRIREITEEKHFQGK
ncbi:MAG: hypothetical protein ACLFN2_05435 [Bacteroidales bacterium]